MQKNKSVFNLTWILSIVVITSIISALTTGVIVYNNNRITNNMSYADLSNDTELNEFLEVYANIISDYYEDIDKKELVSKAIAGMMNYLGDDYTTYMDTDETNDLMQQLVGEYQGIGVSINNGDKSILEVFDDTPASEAGIQVGDIIIGINETDTTNLSGSDVVDIIKEQKGDFTLKLQRQENIISVTLKTKKIMSPDVSSSIIENTKTGYIKIDTFSATVATQFKKALQKIESQGIDNLIIDLRDNTGGYLDVTVDIGSIFTKKNQKLFTLDYKDNVTEYLDKTDESRNYPIVVLVNEKTASASEILTAILKEDYNAQIVGTTTFGKGKVQQTMPLEDGTMVKYTSAYWLTPNGNNIDEIGINPDYVIENENIYDENKIIIGIADKQLEYALSLLNNPQPAE